MGTVGPAQQVKAATHRAADDPIDRDPYNQIVASARTATSRSRFMGEAMRCIAKHFDSPYAALHVRYASEVVQDDCHFGPTNPRFWKASLQQFLTESLAENCARAKLLKSRQGNTKVAFLSVPLFDTSGPAIGGIALVAMGIEVADLKLRLTALESLCRVASVSAEFVGRGNTEPRGSGVSDKGLARAAQCESAEELAFWITNELRNRLGCEQVALGLIRGKAVRIVSISGLDQLPKRTPGMAAVRGAMEECLDAGKTIACPVPDEWSDDCPASKYFLHRQWQALAKGSSVASVPLSSGETTMAILSLRLRSDQLFTRELLDGARNRLEPLIPALLLAERANRSVARHARESARGAISSLTSPGRFGRKIAAMIALSALGWFLFGTMTYELTARCVVGSAKARHLSAPFDGILAEVSAVAGDRVRTGEVLCRFDERELRKEEAQLAAEWAVWERKHDQAAAADSPIDARLALAQQELIAAKREIVRGRIERATLVAPFDGMVVSGDMRTRLGAVLPQGEPLMAIAPLDQWKLDLEVPEHASEDVAEDLNGTFASHARPEHRYPFHVARVLPTVAPRDHTNVVVAEAEIEANGVELRPGMEGVARIVVGRRAVWWVALHRAVDWARMKLWW